MLNRPQEALPIPDFFQLLPLEVTTADNQPPSHPVPSILLCHISPFYGFLLCPQNLL